MGKSDRIKALMPLFRDAGESVLTFLHRLFEPATLERVSKEAVAQLSGILSPKGGTIFRMLLAGVAGYLPSGRIQSISEAIVSMLQASTAGRPAISILPVSSSYAPLSVIFISRISIEV